MYIYIFTYTYQESQRELKGRNGKKLEKINRVVGLALMV